jgi:hypothetical protein
MSPESFQISVWDILIFVAFVVTVVSVGLYQSRSEKGRRTTSSPGAT